MQTDLQVERLAIAIHWLEKKGNLGGKLQLQQTSCTRRLVRECAMILGFSRTPRRKSARMHPYREIFTASWRFQAGLLIKQPRSILD
jgi:hypothetical protein